ncbi:MAG: MerR family DNA-binding transcriptional regulator [Elusimicrobia bacterium]|nr:MerR family DNA-binding transcriptional regulator [Elusimicrobiota bacterium]
MHIGAPGSVVARILGIAPSTLILWANQGRIKCWRTPAGWRLYPESEISRIKLELARERS